LLTTFCPCCRLLFIKVVSCFILRFLRANIISTSETRCCKKFWSWTIKCSNWLSPRQINRKKGRRTDNPTKKRMMMTTLMTIKYKTAINLTMKVVVISKMESSSTKKTKYKTTMISRTTVLTTTIKTVSRFHSRLKRGISQKSCRFQTRMKMPNRSLGRSLMWTQGKQLPPLSTKRAKLSPQANKFRISVHQIINDWLLNTYISIGSEI